LIADPAPPESWEAAGRLASDYPDLFCSRFAIGNLLPVTLGTSWAALYSWVRCTGPSTAEAPPGDLEASEDELPSSPAVWLVNWRRSPCSIPATRDAAERRHPAPAGDRSKSFQLTISHQSRS
jgi:hypothetical protein